jgi:hypothetical protein
MDVLIKTKITPWTACDQKWRIQMHLFCQMTFYQIDVQRNFQRYDMKLKQLALPAVLWLAYASAHAQTGLLGSELGSFAVLGASAVTNTGTTNLTGNLGVSNNSSVSGITGFVGTLLHDGPGVASGVVHQGNAYATVADSQLTAAKTSLSLMGVGTTLGADLTGLTLAPGTYTVLAGTSNLTGAMTLDGGGNANAYWVFQLPSTLITSSASMVNLINTGAGAGVYWNVGSSATLGSNSTFEGNILASASVTMNSGVTLGCGRALAHIGAVTMIADTINAGGCQGLAATSSGGLSGGLSVTEIGGVPVALAYGSVSAVPEPETYAMLLAGIGYIGLILKRRALNKNRTSGRSRT